MRVSKSLIVNVAVLLAIGASCSIASAQVTVGAGTTFVGNIDGSSVAVTQLATGGCTKKVIQTGSWQGDRTVTASSSADTLFAFTWTASHCGFTLEPINTNGWRLNLVGGGGNDRIESYVRNVVPKGGSGADTIAQWEGSAFGGTGNDAMWADARDQLFGEDGDDQFFIINNESARSVDGGAGRDALCGNTDDPLVSIERVIIPIGHDGC